MSEHTCLILGAGASAPYGLPVGKGLATKILTELDHSHVRQLGTTADELAAFQQEFRMSQVDSIDAFLAHNDVFANVGKACIAQILLLAESDSREKLFGYEATKGGHWYRFLRNKVAYLPPNEVDFSTLSIVTFNYDRSLKHYLRQTLANGDAHRLAVADAALGSLEIVHVYGDLGSLEEVEYGTHRGSDEDAQRERVTAAARRIKVIREGQDDDDSLLAARAAIGRATRLAFLGFGFDRLNVRRLGAPGAFLASDGTAKPCYATSKSFSPHQVRDAYKRVFDREDFGALGLEPKGFGYNDCLNLLADCDLLDGL